MSAQNDSYREAARKVLSAEYKDISEAIVKITVTLDNIESHLGDLNSKTKTHGDAIQCLREWQAAHEAVQEAMKGMQRERIKNNIAMIGFIGMAVVNLVIHLTA